MGGVTGPVLVAGAGGSLGRQVAKTFAASGADVRPFLHSDLDIADASAVETCVQAVHPTVVVNCAAITNVDACEEDVEGAFRTNAAGASHLARAADLVGASIVHLSTDYVFDGHKGGYVESDPTNPLQIYGRSKRAGEEFVREECVRHFVVRSAWIYGQDGRNFLSQLPRLIDERRTLEVIADQRSSPTFAPDLAAALLELATTESYGTYHVVNEGSASYAEFFRYGIEISAAPVDVVDTASSAAARPAVRPADTSLKSERWTEAGFVPMRSWREAAEAFLEYSRAHA